MPKPVIPTNVLAAFATRFCLRHCVFLCKGTKLQNSAFAEFWDCLPDFLWRNLVFALEKQGKTYFFKSSQTSRESRFGIENTLSCANALCQNCKKLRFLRLYAGLLFCSLCNQVLPKTLRFSLQRHKAQEFCKAEFLDSMPVLALELGTLFPNSAQAEFGGFGSRLLVRYGFLDAKATN